MSDRPKVFVSGCYDDLHSGHIAFLKEAAGYGDVYVSMGSDATVLAPSTAPPSVPRRSDATCWNPSAM